MKSGTMKVNSFTIRAILFVLAFFLNVQGFIVYAQVGAGSSTLPPAPAPPGSSSLYIQDPYQAPASSGGPLLKNPPSNSFNSLSFGGDDGIKFIQNLGLDVTWIVSGASKKNMGLFRFDVCLDVPLPYFDKPENTLFFEPRFAMNFFNGPKGDFGGEYKSFTSNEFDVSLGLRWLPKFQLNKMATPLNFDFFFSVGLYTDFKRINGRSFRFPSWAYLSLDLTNNIKAKIGVWVLDRVRYTILPSGGVIWTPNDQWEFQILFPNPRITYRPANAVLKDMSLFARGEYGGGSWTVHNDEGTFQKDYNDYRILFGLDWKGPANGIGYFEFGGSFGRELYFNKGVGSYKLNPGFILQAGLHF